MNQYTFSATAKTVTIGAMIVGVVSMLLTWFVGADDLQSRFWSNFLHNSTFFLGISMMAFFFIAVCITGLCQVGHRYSRECGKQCLLTC